MLPHGGLSKTTLTLAFSAGTHRVVAQYLGLSTVSAAAADREVRALR